MLRNALFATASREPNANVGVVINNVYVEVEGVHFDPDRGCLVLVLDAEALQQAIGRGRDDESARKEQADAAEAVRSHPENR
ncbi:hypothetical protein [Paractinoplanes rishiriensis]|uniref:Uncharacterized protein n=1 Tax=Paractinoplanes rishiriensis TaxID=1050105 RepID=A0A919JVT8_9ACTN|nr:hypothetical protein [Actinoplanes rishiriensis]GIE94068.1 hypothetical protein Ari01nite_15330 [Actinoplanes rishiriensis]